MSIALKHQVAKLFELRDASSLAFNRILFGILLILDLVQERGLSQAHLIWADDSRTLRCRFPVSESITRFEEPEAMFAVYSVMFLALIGIVLGFYYRISCIVYAALFWYLLLIEKSRWNNHSYLFGLLALQNLFNDSHSRFSIDSWRLNLSRKVPLWQYALFRFQIFLVYFYAGIKKIDSDWLGGYSMVSLSQHPVWSPLKLILSDEFIDYYVIHLTGFLFDLTVGFFFLIARTRPYAFVVCALFNVTNSQLFTIGMFPWAMIAMMPIFCSCDWPVQFYDWVNNRNKKQQNNEHGSRLTSRTSNKFQWNIRRVFCVVLMVSYVGTQLLLPFAHRFMPGLNTWTNGLYGYSWDMMVHNWNRLHTRVKIKTRDRYSHTTKWQFVDPEMLTFNQRWTHHADMALQYTHCLRRILEQDNRTELLDLRLDVWTSLNGRFVQRMFKPTVNLVNARWSLFERATWVQPLARNSQKWRETAERLQFDLAHSENKGNNSLTVFVADFPGCELETIIEGVDDAQVHLLSGKVKITTESQEFFLVSGDTLPLTKGECSIRPFGENEAYYAIHYSDLQLNATKTSNKQSSHKSTTVRSIVATSEFFPHSTSNILKGLAYLTQKIRQTCLPLLFMGECECTKSGFMY